jgi:hypothetical protein
MDRAGVPRQTAKQITSHKTDAVYNRYRIANGQDVREGMPQAQAWLTAQKSGHGADKKALPENHHPISKFLIFLSGGVSVLVCRLDFKSSDRG